MPKDRAIRSQDHSRIVWTSIPGGDLIVWNYREPPTKLVGERAGRLRGPVRVSDAKTFIRKDRIPYLLQQRIDREFFLELLLDVPNIVRADCVGAEVDEKISESKKQWGVSDEPNLPDLYSLVATCMANGKDPLAYLTDILGRIGSHPASRLDEILPQNWSPPA